MIEYFIGFLCGFAFGVPFYLALLHRRLKHAPPRVLVAAKKLQDGRVVPNANRSQRRAMSRDQARRDAARRR